MKITLVTGDGKRHSATQPYEGADYVAVDGWICACGVPHAWGVKPLDHDTHRSTAACPKCGADVGVLEAKVDTLFGIDEDDAIRLRCRVY